MAEIAPAVRVLINEHISSVAQLEVILLLRHAADRCWSVEVLSTELRADRAWLSHVLQDLCERGMAEKSGDEIPLFRYRPRSEELERSIGALAQDYLLHRVRVIELIYTKPSPAVRAFAHAFDLRKGKPDG
jgi:hypothetical protein